MAETAIGLVVDRLIPLLSEEAKLLRGVHKQVDEINRELQYIQAFLKDADQRAGADSNRHGVKLWVDELREVAENIEDAIDEYIQDIAERQANQQEQNSLRRRFVCFLRKVSRFIVKLKPRHKIASKIRDLKEQVLEMNRRAEQYKFNSVDRTNPQEIKKSWHDPRDDAIFLKETEVVGIQSDKNDLVARLVAPEHSVIALVGMGGIGKTTLANQVFKDKKFDCHAWVSVSQSYNKLELLRTLIKRFCESKKESAPQGIDKEKMNKHL